MDLDGDGYLSMYELEYFYEEQLQRMEQLGIETLPFEDCLCQVNSSSCVQRQKWHGFLCSCKSLQITYKINYLVLDAGHDWAQNIQHGIIVRFTYLSYGTNLF